MSFAAIAQFGPSFFGGLFWRGANARGAALGMSAGILVWAYTLLLPSLLAPGTPILTEGLFGIEALRPQALFGTVAEPLNHGVLWSLVDQHAVLRARLAVARLGAAGAHPGVDLRAARHQSDAEPQALPHRRHRQRPQGYDHPLSRRRAHRALVPDLRARTTAASSPATSRRAWSSCASPNSCSPARSARPRPASSCRCCSSATTRPPRTRSACSTTRPRRCSTTATCCRSRSTRWSRASRCSTRICG